MCALFESLCNYMHRFYKSEKMCEKERHNSQLQYKMWYILNRREPSYRIVILGLFVKDFIRFLGFELYLYNYLKVKTKCL